MFNKVQIKTLVLFTIAFHSMCLLAPGENVVETLSNNVANQDQTTNEAGDQDLGELWKETKELLQETEELLKEKTLISKVTLVTLLGLLATGLYTVTKAIVTTVIKMRAA